MWINSKLKIYWKRKRSVLDKGREPLTRRKRVFSFDFHGSGVFILRKSVYIILVLYKL
jgi:hypothetical protein